MMQAIRFGILLAGILLIRKAAWKRISRLAQYSIWIFAALFLLLDAFLPVHSPFSIENMLYSAFPNREQAIAANDMQTDDDTTMASSKKWLSMATFIANSTEQAQNMADNMPIPPQGYAAEKYPSEYYPFKNYPLKNHLSKNRLPKNYLPKNHLPESYPSESYPSESYPSEKDIGGLNSFIYAWETGQPKMIADCWRYAKYGITYFLLIMAAISNIRFHLFCRKNRVFHKEIKEWGLHMYSLKGIPSPFLSGRNIYVDMDCVRDEKMLRHIVMHEYCHFRHKDIFWTFVRTLCLALHWYNPFVWLANDFVKRDCELACDETALRFLGAEEEIEYGYTLLALLKHSNAKKKYPSVVNPPVVTTMGSNMKRMKERIAMIHSTKKCHAFALWLTLLSITALTGCAFAKKEETAVSDNHQQQEMPDTHTADPAVFMEGTVMEETVIEETVPDSLLESADAPKEEERDGRENASARLVAHGNPYCNVSAKYYDGYTYLASAEGIYRIADGSDDWQLIYSGTSTLGTIAEGYLFFYSYPENAEDAAILSLDLSTGESAVSLPLGKDAYAWREMYYENGSLYIQAALDAKIASFEIKPGGVLEEKEVYSVTVPERLQNAETKIRALSPIISRSEGFLGTFYYGQKEETAFPDSLYFYTDNSQMYQLEGITDIMITSKGIIGRNAEQYNDVYLCDIYTGEKKLLYSAAQNDNRYFGYNTYDDFGVYGLLRESDDSFSIARISWEGTPEKLLPVENTDALYGIHVRMSVVDGWVYYYDPQSGEMERRKVTPVSLDR